MNLADRLAHLDPCDNAREWLAGYTDPRLAWAECPRGDWLLLIAEEAGIAPNLAWTLREIVAPAFDAVSAALDAVGVDHDLRHHAEQLRSEGSTAIVDSADSAACAAARAAGAACAAGAAYAAADAATTATYAAAHAATTPTAAHAAYAATAAAEAAQAAQADAEAAYAAQADALRRLWPEPPPAVLALCEVTA